MDKREVLEKGLKIQALNALFERQKMEEWNEMKHRIDNLFEESQNVNELKRGDLVWAKIPGHSYWPAMVLNETDCGKSSTSPNKHWLFWFGEHTISEVPEISIEHFKTNYKQNVSKNVRCKEQFKKAVEEAISLIVIANNIKLGNVSVMSWALDGFESNEPLSFQWIQDDLPAFIQEALSADDSDHEEDPKTVIKKVRKKEISIDEICLACGKQKSNLVQQHPVFEGKVCQACKKDVDRINKFPLGRSHIYCVICGQGGTIVYCDSKTCCRAYCCECILYLDSKNAFSKISATKHWLCYACKPTRRRNCLIKKRCCIKHVKTSSMSPKPSPSSNNTNLPKFADDSLSEDESESEDEVKRSVQKVLHGKKHLDDLCIGCCQENTNLVKEHPLFVGQICEQCKKDVDRINNLPSGKRQRYCIVCGQGGLLLYCSKKTCQRAYCEECIKYLDLEKTLTELSSVDEWSCYLCQPVLRKTCLIQKRALKQKFEEILNPASCSSALNETTCTPMNIDDSEDSIDFSETAASATRSELEMDCSAAIPSSVTISESEMDSSAAIPSSVTRSESEMDYSAATPSDKAASTSFVTDVKKEFVNSQEFKEPMKPNGYFAASEKTPASFVTEVKKDFMNGQDSTEPMKPNGYFTASETNDVVEDLREGKILLEDICISCRKKDARCFLNHPLFAGRMCADCYNQVFDVCVKYPSEKRQDFCAICGGQSNNFVRCAYKTCSRAYCKKCVEELDSPEAYIRISQKVNWKCYTSEAYELNYGKSLIQSRCTSPHRQSETNSKVTMQAYLQSDVREAIWNRQLDLEDICIACGKGIQELFLQCGGIQLVNYHPLFFGSICESCKSDVAKICLLPSGKAQEQCIVCGQGGYLVYCVEEKCSRAYCQECIDFLDSEDAFKEITKISFWLCYYCKPSDNQKCLIQKRDPPDYYYYYSYGPLKLYRPPTPSTDEVFRKLQKGKCTLQDMCIGCFKENIRAPKPHPLFRGILCRQCDRYVLKACKTIGKIQDACVVCGQGETFVYCTNSRCLRAYCERCVNYFDVKEAYKKILKKKDWFCYFCNLNPSEKCRLQRRINGYVKVIDFPEVPEKKEPIRVVPPSETVLEALKKADIKVKQYKRKSGFPGVMSDAEFNGDEPDLFIGSYFVKDEKKSREQLAEDFKKTFEKFQNRRVFHIRPFFIFIGDYQIMDADILSNIAKEFNRGCHYCPILPVLFEFDERKFLVWSNLSACMPKPMEKENARSNTSKHQGTREFYIDIKNSGPFIDQRHVIGGPFINIKIVEKEIIYFFVNYTRDHFQSEY